MQDRRGPNRVGIPLTKIKMFGLGQPLADGLKFIFKEEYTPAHVDKFLYTLAPISILVAAILPFAVIPFGSVLPTFDVAGQAVNVKLTLAPDIDVAMIFVFAMGSIAVYGVILGGWASNNKYSFLGGLRSSAQLIAYELPLGLGILGVVLATGSLRLDAIIREQATTGTWNVLVQPLGFLVFLIASFAESARLPFDLPEAEQELIGGYHTEYSGLAAALVLDRRIPAHGHGRLPDHDPVLRRLASVGRDRQQRRRHHLGYSAAARDRAHYEGDGRNPVLHVGALELAALPLRSIDVAGLEGDAAVGHGQPGDRGCARRVP